MNTSTGRKLAEKRHNFMLSYLDQFYQEWKGLK
ncbi:MAG: phosphohydrolase, partial [Eudoraea sp.]